MDFISFQHGTGKRLTEADTGSSGTRLALSENRAAREKTEPGQTPLPFNPRWIVQLLTKHLKTAADPENRNALRGKSKDLLLQTGIAKPEKVTHGVFRAGENQQIGDAQLSRAIDKAKAEGWVVTERGKISEVGDMRQADDGNVYLPLLLPGGEHRGKAVLLVKIHIQKRHYAEDRDLCQLLDLPEPGLKEAQIPTEFVDDKARKALPFFRK